MHEAGRLLRHLGRPERSASPKEKAMSAKLKHLAIVSDQYTLLERFYEAMFGMKPSPDNPPAGAVVVSDGYVGLNINPRKGKAGRQAGLDHFGFEVEDVEQVLGKLREKYPGINVLKRL